MSCDMSYDIVLKRIYQPADAEDGARVLVDRLCPRGKRRESLALTEWYRDASPSPALRRQFHQAESSADVFAARYRGELRQAVLDALLEEDGEDLEPASSPCYASQFKDRSPPEA